MWSRDNLGPVHYNTNDNANPIYPAKLFRDIIIVIINIIDLNEITIYYYAQMQQTCVNMLQRTQLIASTVMPEITNTKPADTSILQATV